MSDVAIRVEGLGKRYRIGTRERYRTLRDTIAGLGRLPGTLLRGVFAGRRDGGSDKGRDTFWALRDVSFSLERGEVLGIIGRNGAGKSTLLKILCRITEPTRGWAEIHGRVGSLLEVGTGFHPEMTGRENVYLNGAILGMRRAEIERKFDEIVAFAGVERFIDTPVKRYSSGMHMRLAFAVAAHLETEILLVDEVLAVGDAAFQLKCLNKMSGVSASGKTILFVSHNLEAVTKLCGRAILLERGTIAADGTPQECVERYLVDARGRPSDSDVSLRTAPRRSHHKVSGPVRLSGLTILGEDGAPTWTVPSGGTFTAVLRYEFAVGAGPQEATFAITFSNLHNHRLASCRSHDTHLTPIRVEGAGRVVCRILRLQLSPGVYRLSVGCVTEAGFSDGIDDAATIEVAGAMFYPSGTVPPRSHGEVLFNHEWQVFHGE